MTCQIANVFKREGVKKGDRVALYMPASPLLAASMLACARIGAIHVAINSLHVKCVKCSTLYAVGMYLLLVILPITIFFILVVMFRPSFVSDYFTNYNILYHVST